MADLERMHISYLNSTYDLRRLEQWKAETVEDESGLEAIGKRLGYRFVVEGVEFVSEREELQITLENKGFAELTEEADCYLELERNGTLTEKNTDCNRCETLEERRKNHSLPENKTACGISRTRRTETVSGAVPQAGWKNYFICQSGRKTGTPLFGNFQN